jgi:hypothetical protein
MPEDKTQYTSPFVEDLPPTDAPGLKVAPGASTIDIGKPGVKKAASLNSNPNPGDVSYKVLGLLTWAVLIFCLVTLFAAPRLLLNVARVVAIYMMIRLIAFTYLHLVALLKVRSTEKQARSSPYQGLPNREIARHSAIHHLVVIPNFDEPLDMLSRTLHSLAVQEGAQQHMTVVLAMEEREPDARTKAQKLLGQYRDKFFLLKATFHPSGLPGEAAGKGVNETWAVRQVRHELVDGLGISPDAIVVTVSDSDSIAHPHYFAELTRQFAACENRYQCFWQPPILFDNDIWKTSAPIRLLTFFSNAVYMGDYVNPLEAKFPYSTYSTSLKLLEEISYWDPTVIAEDVNIFMRAFFATQGKAVIQRIFLPTRGNPIYGHNLWHAIAIFYRQKVRHAWGGVEIGYIFQKWSLPGVPFFYKLGRLLKMFHDHLFFSTAGFIVTLGTLLSGVLDKSFLITLPPVNFAPLLFAVLNLLGGTALGVVWFTERTRLSRGWIDWSLKPLLSEIVSWVIFPVLSFLLLNLPGLQAQTKMVLGQPFQFNRTPKELDSKVGE